MDNNCVKLYPDRTREYEVMARTRCEQTDGQRDRVIPIYPPNIVCRGYNDIVLFLSSKPDHVALIISLKEVSEWDFDTGRIIQSNVRIWSIISPLPGLPRGLLVCSLSVRLSVSLSVTLQLSAVF